MAKNPIPSTYAGLILLTQRCLNGAVTLGASIPLLINTSTTIKEDRDALLVAQSVYQAGCGGFPALRAALDAAHTEGYTFCGQARNVLEFYLGTVHSAAWRPAGFITSLALPRDEAALVTLLTALEIYFTANPTHENAELQVTAARAKTLLGHLTVARKNVDAQVAGCTLDRQTRDAKVKEMEKRIRGLIKELGQRLTPLDARWRDFGLNMPGAASVPAAPENVVAVPTLPGQLQVTCDASPTATSYRFYYQRPILDPEPIHAGNATDPLFILSGLTPGQLYLVYTSATNAGGESILSKPASATVSAAAAA